MLIKQNHSKGGRNFTGRITCYHRGGGHKRRGRWVSFNYSSSNDKINSKGLKFNKEIGNTSIKLTYDPSRTGLVGLDTINNKLILLNNSYFENRNKEISTNMVVGVTLGELPAHTNVFNIEMVAGKGGQLVRAAGTFGTIINHVGNYTRVRLPSSEQRLIPSNCKCSVGVVGGISRKEKNKTLHKAGKGKAGRSRWLGRRPTVRGTARNPIDHPHGGGEGKTSGGRPSVTPWSKAKGVRTSSNKGSTFVVVTRRGVGIGR